MESKGIVKGQFTDWSTHFRGSKNVKIQCFSGSMSLNPLRSGSYNAPRHFKLSSFSWSFLIYMFFSGEKSQFNYFFLFQCFTCNRNSRSYVFHKEGVFKNFGKFPGEHLDWSLIKLQAEGLYFYLKKFGTGVFKWILRSFWKHLFYSTPPGKCFCFKE